jgi:hypothetical protein
MEFSRLYKGSAETYLSLLTILAVIVFGIAGIQFGFLIPFGILFAILLTAVIVLNIKIGLVLLLCSFFYVRPIYYFPFSILTYIRLDDFLWGLVAISWLVNIWKTKRRSVRSLPLFGALTILCALATLSGMRVFMLSPSLMPIGNFIWFLMRLLQYVSVYFIVGTIDFTDKERNSLFTLMIMFGMVVTGIVLLQYWGLLGIFPTTRYVENPGAITGTFTFKAQIGAVAVILSILVVDKIIRHKWNRWLGFVLLGGFSGMLLITQSRSSWVAFLVAIVVYLLSIRSLQSKMIWATMLILAGILFLGIEGNRELYNSHPILDPLTGGLSHDEAVSERLTSLPLIFQYLEAKPDVFFLGIGFMNWRYILTDVTGIYAGHNNYISALVELGLLGFIAFCYLLFRGLLIAWRNIRLNQPFSQLYLSLLVGLCAACFFEDIFWPGAALESFLAFFMFLSALSLQSVLHYPTNAVGMVQ